MTEQRARELLVDVGRRCKLAKCPPGLFRFGDTLAMKSEYKSVAASGFYQSDAYCVESGEYFWGGAISSEARERLIVQPVRATPFAESAKSPSDSVSEALDEESLAERLCDDFDARIIAGREYAPSYSESADHVQDYWRCIARAALQSSEADNG